MPGSCFYACKKNRSFLGYFGSTFAAELRPRRKVGAAIRTVGLPRDFCTAVGAELSIRCQWSFAFRARGPDCLVPVPLCHLLVFIRSRGVRPYVLNGFRRLSCAGFYRQVWRAAFAQPALRIPAALPAHPTRTLRALHKIRLDFDNRFLEGLVTRFLPTGRANSFGKIGCLSENPPKNTAGGIHGAGNISSRRRFELRAVTGAAPVAPEFKLKSTIRA